MILIVTMCCVLTAWSMWAAFWLRAKVRKAFDMRNRFVLQNLENEAHPIIRNDGAFFPETQEVEHQYRRMRTQVTIEGSHDGVNWAEINR